jgi:restriction system protein
MASIWFKRAELVGATTEVVGYKAGLTLARDAAARLAGPGFSELWEGADDANLRIRAEEFEALVAQLLYAVGAIASASQMPAPIKLYHKYKSDPKKASISMAILEKLAPALEAMLADAKAKGLKAMDPTPFFDTVRQTHGPVGVLMAVELFEGINEGMFRNPWFGMRRVDWQDRAALEDLFHSESLETQYGTFIDQRRRRSRLAEDTTPRRSAGDSRAVQTTAGKNREGRREGAFCRCARRKSNVWSYRHNKRAITRRAAGGRRSQLSRDRSKSWGITGMA